jgi:hypothetical protein
MTRSNLLAVITFAVVFAAGVMVGKLGWRGTPDDASDGAWIAEHLNLDAKQRDAVRKIWLEQLSSVSSGSAATWENVERQREQKVRAILDSDRQRAAYDEIVAWYAVEVKAFRNKVNESQKAAEEQTKALLNASQRERFERLVSDRNRRQARPVPLPKPVSDIRPATSGSPDALVP